MYRVFLENDQVDAQFDGGVVRLWGENIKQIATTSGVSILKQTDNSDEVQEISVEVKPKQEEPAAKEKTEVNPNDKTDSI